MKHLLTILSFIFLLLSCNISEKKISQVELSEITIDTLTTIEASDIYMTKDFVLGKFDYKNDSTFLKVNPPYSAKAVYLNNQVVNSFLKMYQAAMADGIELKIISGTRNFEEQKVIWERKWEMYQNLEPLARALKILEYSSMPSSSRHHWGTDIDLNSLNNSYFHSGKGLKAYQWLKTYANAYGFYQVYTEKDQNRTGYNLEKWHWSYLPLASRYLEFYNANIIDADINGFEGYEQSQNVKIIKHYVNGISKTAKDYK